MLDLPGYRMEKLHRVRGPIHLFSAVRVEDGASVFLKLGSLSEEGSEAALTREYGLLAKLKHDKIVAAELLLRTTRQIALVLRRGSFRLLENIPNHGFETETFLNLAGQIGTALSHIHNEGVLHQNLKPQSILLDSDAKNIKLTGFELATSAQRERKRIYKPDIIKSSLHFSSPEQTGRMGRSIDFRSDLYSLGVTFYYMITGFLPFSAEPLELVHLHLAVIPKPPNQIKPKVPDQISRIIMKLLEKDPEKRYQTAGGLRGDLAKCLSMLRRTGTISPFPLGEREIPYTLMLPVKLYGRAKELEILKKTYRQSLEGPPRLALVTGQPGVGKTSLVTALHKNMTETQARFLKCRCDRFQVNIPFGAITTIISAWIDSMLTGSDASLNDWRARFRKELSDHTPLLLEMVPRFSLIFQDKAKDSEKRERPTQKLEKALQQFFQVISRRDSPLMLFFDDLQWVDTASLSLIESLLGTKSYLALMIVGTYPEKQDPNHPLNKMLHRLAAGEAPPTFLTLQPWSLTELNSFIADTLERSPLETPVLSDLIQRKTAAAPLFVRQFLFQSYETGLISFIPGKGWQWDLNGIEESAVPENIVQMMTQKIADLPPRTQEVIKLAGCIGQQFDLATLVAIGPFNENEIALDLSILNFQGLIIPSGNDYQFSHNRIYEAAVNLVSTEKRAAIHFKIGNFRLGNASNEDLKHNIFEIVDHLNSGIPLIVEQEKRIRLAKLNYQAGKKAMESGAFATASAYLEPGLDILEGQSFSDHFDLLFNYHRHSAEILFRIGRLEEAETRFRKLLKQDLGFANFAKVIGTMIGLYTLAGQPDQAVQVALNGLQKLDCSIPENPLANTDLNDLDTTDPERFWLLLRQNPPKTEEIESKRILAQLRILTEMLTPCFFTSMEYTAQITETIVALHRQHGKSPFFPIGTLLFAILKGPIWENFRDRYQLCQIASYQGKQEGIFTLLPRIRIIQQQYFEPWAVPYRECLKPIGGYIKEAADEGDFQFAAYGTLTHLHQSFLAGEYLPDISELAMKYAAYCEQLGYERLVPMCQLFSKIVTALNRRQSSAGDQSGARGLLQELEQLKQLDSQIGYHFCTPHVVAALFRLGDHQAAFQIAEQLKDSMEKVLPSSQQVVEHLFFHALSVAAIRDETGSSEGEKVVAILENAIAQMSRWASLIPVNFNHRVLLLQAEKARVTGQISEAFFLYAKAIADADEDRPDIRALIEERRASHALASGFEKDAGVYLESCIAGYKQWGAQGVVQWLQHLWSGKIRNQTTLAHVQKDRQSGDNTPYYPKLVLDFETVLQSSLAISQEVEPERVLQRVIASALANAGAQRGVLLLLKGNDLSVRAEGSAEGGFFKATETLVDSYRNLPVSVLRYVQRTNEPLVLGDAVNRGLFQNDPYIQRTKTRSVLVFPIVSQTKVLGILYLENNLLSNAFTEDRLEVLRLISAQAAISIENAFLYDELSLLNRELEARVDSRTEELKKANQKLTQEIEDRIKAQKQLEEVQGKLLEAARRAGMTEMAVGVLHNVGNVLNSITISIASMAEDLKNSKLSRLENLVELLNQEQDLRHFFEENPKGRIFPQYLTQLRLRLAGEQKKLKSEIKRLTQHLSHAIEVIRAQQDHAKIKDIQEPSTPVEVVEQALKISSLAISQKGVRIVKDFQDLPAYVLERHKVLQILINLIINGIQAMETEKIQHPTLTVRTCLEQNGRVCFSVSDNGKGIPAKHLTEIFSYGFTTRKEGHGFGLHNAANAAAEMNGNLKAVSSGIGKGATFSLILPLRTSAATPSDYESK